MQRSEINLASLAQEFSRTDPKYNYFHGKIFSCLLPQPDQFIEFLSSINIRPEGLPNKHPARILIGDLSKWLAVQSSFVPTIGKQGLELHCILSKPHFPDRDYFGIVSPAPREGQLTNYTLANETIGFLRSLIALHYGKLPFYTYVGEFDFDIDGKVSVAGEVFRRPVGADFFSFVDPQLGKEILSRLEFQLADTRNRIQRASNFFSNAMIQKGEMFRFSAYWISLEVLVGGIDDAIKSKLGEAYEVNKHEVGRALFFDEIAQLRHDLLHKGVFPGLYSYQERLLQLYFWDILIHQIGLQSRRLAGALVNSGTIEEEKARFAFK